jgi:hypothetical protein
MNSSILADFAVEVFCLLLALCFNKHTKFKKKKNPIFFSRKEFILVIYTGIDFAIS